jgi:hypothetical protein
VSDLTRKGFMKSTVGAAAGMTAIGALAASQAEADDMPVGTESVVAYVKDPSSGEIAVMSGDREVIVRDPKLAAKIARAGG